VGVSIFHVIMFSYSMGLEIYVCGVFHVSFALSSMNVVVLPLNYFDLNSIFNSNVFSFLLG
jgi:hypothetical protein